MRGTRDVDLPLGDGNARTTATRGYKSWFSTREAGLTVESTVSVEIACGQNKAEIVDAAGMAGQLADDLAKNGLKEMGFALMQDIPEEVRHGLSKQLKAENETRTEVEEPPRRSEKKYRRP